MSIEVIYQGLSIAKDARFRLQEGGIFVHLAGPMPVATPLSLQAGDHTLRGKVRRVVEKEGEGAGMLVAPAEGTRLPRWLKDLAPEIAPDVEFEPEPVQAKAEPEPIPAPVDAKAEPEPTPAPVDAKAEPEPTPAPVDAKAEPEP